ncbi:MAG: HXXEE domain-containing protein [Bariatricus sp.]
MNFLRNNWYRAGLIFFAALSFFMIFWGCELLSDVQKILMASLMALPLHQYEEYVMPGGGPVVINRAFYGEQTKYRRYPGNWNSIMIVNLSAYIFYIVALLFPQVIWLGIATMLFNLFQVLGHVFEMNIKLKTWYNPGMATSIFLFLPISLFYFIRMCGRNLVSGSDWILGAAALAGILAVTVILPVQCLKNENSPYEIPEEQVERFEKVRGLTSVWKKK